MGREVDLGLRIRELERGYELDDSEFAHFLDGELGVWDWLDEMDDYVDDVYGSGSSMSRYAGSILGWFMHSVLGALSGDYGKYNQRAEYGMQELIDLDESFSDGDRIERAIIDLLYDMKSYIVDNVGHGLLEAVQYQSDEMPGSKYIRDGMRAAVRGARKLVALLKKHARRRS